MENAVDALKQAAAVLIFVVALTASFTMFSKAKQTADAVTTIQDQQEYLESAELRDKLYINSEDIENSEDTRTVASLTMYGDRVVKPDDVISTIYRYNLEKYGVTIINEDGTVITRFDSNTEAVIRQWYNIGNMLTAEEIKEKFASQIKTNITHNTGNYVSNIKLDRETLEEIYKITVDGNNKITVGAPWYGNDKEIIKRINSEIDGSEYQLNKQYYNKANEKKLNEILNNAHEIIEVINEIDNSNYLKDENDKNTSLLQQYELPTVEVVYILN